MAQKAEKGFEIESLIGQILDSDSFVKILSRVMGKSPLGEAAGEGVVSGFGTVDDTRVGVFGTLSEVQKGAIGTKSAKMISAIIDSAVKVGAPIIGFLDSEGARFAEGINAMEGYGGIIAALSRAHGLVPIIIVIKGACYGQLSFVTSFCDLCIAMDGAKIATSSPLILAANAGEDTSKVASIKVHEKSGIITNTVKTADELKKLISDALKVLTNTDIQSQDDANRVAKSLKNGANASTIIKEIMDDGAFIPVRENFGDGIITGFARLFGTPVGIVANDSKADGGRITADGAYKATAFVSMCENFRLPIILMVDSVGVTSNLADENSSLIRNISDLLFALNTASTCKVALITGNAIGLAYTAFASKNVVDYSIAWDGASIGMLSDVQTATLLYSPQIAKAKNKDELTERLAAAYGKENSGAEVVAESGYIDNIINPALSRQYLIAAVQTFAAKER